MSYTTSQVDQANKECRHLGGRGGEGTKIGDRWIINPTYGGNPDCVKSSSGNIVTAGVGGNIPKVVWWLAGLGAIYYIGKQQKWF